MTSAAAFLLIVLSLRLALVFFSRAWVSLLALSSCEVRGLVHVGGWVHLVVVVRVPRLLSLSPVCHPGRSARQRGTQDGCGVSRLRGALEERKEVRRARARLCARE